MIACLHLSLHLLRSVTNKDDECLTDQVIECADRIEGYIVEQRRMSNEDRQFFKCQRKLHFPVWLQNDIKSADSTLSGQKRYRQGTYLSYYSLGKYTDIYGIFLDLPTRSVSSSVLVSLPAEGIREPRSSTPLLSTPSGSSMSADSSVRQTAVLGKRYITHC